MIEAGVPGFISDTWNAISAPPKTPRPIVPSSTRRSTTSSTSRTPRSVSAISISRAGGTPEDMAKLKQDETARWGKVIKDAGIQPQ